MTIPFNTIKATALASIDAVLNRWVPGGKRHGDEYQPTNPTRSDGKPGSFSINLKTGAWADFATADKGGDLVALVAYIDGVKQSEAAERLAEFLGIKLEKSDLPKRATRAQSPAAEPTTPAQAKAAPWRALLPVPADAPQPPKTHPKHGAPSMRWLYRDAGGGLVCLVYRFEAKTEGGKKQFYPLTYCEDASGKRAWRWQGVPEPRPLYQLDKLAAAPDAPVIVCEGEKAADAAAVLFPDAIATTMLNGAQSPHKTDWQPLAGRVVWLWPDNDAAGQACMVAVAGLLTQAGAASVQRLNLAAFARTPGSDADGKPTLTDAAPLPEKWDAADALAQGWTAAHSQLLRDQTDFLQTCEATAPPSGQQQSATLDKAAPHNPKTPFLCTDEGVWHFGKNDNGTEAPALWLCSKLEITALTRDAKNEAWGRLIEFDDLDGTHHTWALPMDLLKGDGTEYRGMLLSMGLQLSTMQKARNLLTQYIQTARVETRARCVERTGWHGGVFVMPERTIGEADERILYQSASAAPGTFRQRGTLADWQAHVAAPCMGNSRLLFAVSAAFAAPLLEITGMESGGFHFRGDSSTGKTTALRLAASIWGGTDYLQRWRATDNGLEALAAQHSDCLLVLDELSQVDPKAAGEVAYMLANGSGKARANRTGAMRDTASWRLLFVSSGEAGLAEHMALANRKPKAGMEVRLLDIPADAGHGLGLFDTLHDHASGAVFSKAITEAALKYYGSPSVAFLHKLVEHRDKISGMVKKGQQQFMEQHLPADAGGQSHRAALRFALVGVAGELATVWGITGWAPGSAMQAAATCFKAWLSQRGGAGNQEAAAMLAQVRQFFELHGDARFTDWDRATDDHAPKTLNRAGFRKTSTTTGETEYYVLREVFRGDVCRGFDYRAIAKQLAGLGCLEMEGRSYTRKERLPGMGNTSCYRINAKLWSGDHEQS
ncbi:MAG: DUF927 domain-containing protein [Pseudomonadota bacterium]